MYEVEVKAALPDPAEARARLVARGATRKGEEQEVDAYFNHPDPARDFATTDEALRIRAAATHGQETGAPRVELTFKGPKLDARTKTREELDVPLPSAEAAEAMAAVLLKLGFRSVATVRKHRETWRWGEASVCLDTVQGLGTFVEVELQAATEEAARALGGEALALLEALGAGLPLRTSYLELLLAKGGAGDGAARPGDASPA